MWPAHVHGVLTGEELVFDPYRLSDRPVEATSSAGRSGLLISLRHGDRAALPGRAVGQCESVDLAINLDLQSPEAKGFTYPLDDRCRVGPSTVSPACGSAPGLIRRADKGWALQTDHKCRHRSSISGYVRLTRRYNVPAGEDAQQRLHADVVADTCRSQACPQQEASTGTCNPEGPARVSGSISRFQVVKAASVN